jgi:hypothetical protein
MRNYQESLNRLICDMTSLKRVYECTHPKTNDTFVELVEDNVTTRYRWDIEDGFISCGEVLF